MGSCDGTSEKVLYVRLCRVLAVDHATGYVFLVGLHREDDADAVEAAESWLTDMTERLEALSKAETQREASHDGMDARRTSHMHAGTSGREDMLAGVGSLPPNDLLHAAVSRSQRKALPIIAC